MYFLKVSSATSFSEKFKTEPLLMRKCQDQDLDPAVNSVHPHQDSSLNHISWHKKEEGIFLNFQDCRQRKKQSSKKENKVITS